VVPTSEQSQVALVLGRGVLFDDLRVVRVEDTPLPRRRHTAARLALDPCDQATDGAQGVLFGQGGLQARRLPSEWAYQREAW